MTALAHQTLGRPILMADSIHNILAVSDDVAERFGKDVRWKRLVEEGWLPSPPRPEAGAYIYVHRNTLDNRIAKLTERISGDWNLGSYCTAMLYSTWFYLRKEGWLRDSMLHLPET